MGNWGDIPRGKRAGNSGIWGESHGLALPPSSRTPPAQKRAPAGSLAESELCFLPVFVCLSAL